MIFRDRLKEIEKRKETLEKDLSDPSVIKDQNKFQKLSKELASIRPIVEAFANFTKVEKELKDVQTALKDTGLDEEMKALYDEEAKTLEKQQEDLQVEIEDLLLKESDVNSNRDVLLEIRAGTGGDEAALFAADLFRMYSKFAVEKGLKCEIMNANSTGIGGFKELIVSIRGANVYSLFKYESGIHRVQRVPETESSGRIHTSAVTVAVLAEADEEEISIDPSDLRIDVFRASGAGGQHVNKTESAVRITHMPTGFVVSCQDERSQHKNKAKAMRVLRARIYEMKQAEEQKQQATLRKSLVGSGDRSGKIRTYNFHEKRVTDHRISLTLHSLDDILNGHLDEIVNALAQHERTQKLIDAA